MAALGAAALTLAGCSSLPSINWSWRPTFAPIDLRAPPPVVTVRRGGPSGELLNGPAPPVVPDGDVDAAIADALRPSLTANERRQLAEASQRAAGATTDTTIPWVAGDGGPKPTAAGTVIPVDDAYRSVRGRICRDVRQTIDRHDAPLLAQVTLCRTDRGNGLFVWLVGQADQ